MTQKARYNHEEALQMISKGTPLAKIAKHFGVSYQSIYDLRKKKKIDKPNGKRVILIDPSLEQLEDWLISRIAAAREVDRLKNQLAATKNALNIAQQDLELLQKKENERGNRERQFALAKQQGEIGGNNER